MIANVSAISHAIAAGAYLLLLGLLVAGCRRPGRGLLLIFACAGSVIWALGLALTSTWPVLSSPAVVVVLEWLRVAGWLAFLGGILYFSDAATDWRSPWLPVAGVAMAVALAACVLLYTGRAATLGLAGLLGVAVTGLLFIEQIYRRVVPDQRWGIKHLCLGLGVVFAFDFYLYADALLLGRFSEPVWLARGLVDALAVPLLAVSAARNPTWALDVGVSRRIVVDSLVLTGTGIYLLLMAVAGYYIRYVGGTWGTVLQTTFLAGAAVLLMVTFFSGSVRAGLRVFVSKHFFSYRYDYREEWLRFVATLADADSGEPLRNRAIRALAEIMDSPAGVLFTITEQGNYALAGTWNVGYPGIVTEPGGGALPDYLAEHGWIVDLTEYRSDPDRYPGLSLPGWLSEVPDAWLIVPLFQLSRLQGFVVLARPRVPRRLDWEDRDLLKTAGRQIAGYVALLDTADALIDARQFDAFNRLSAYVVHDLKNVCGQLALIGRNAERYRDNPAFVDDAFHTVENARQRMERMLAQLRKVEMPVEPVEGCELDEVLTAVARATNGRRPEPELRLEAEGLRVNAPRGRLQAVLEHLVRNAQEAAGEAGAVTVQLAAMATGALVEVADDGPGMSETFVRERLFRPFATTKGNAGMGIGVFEARQFVEAMGGTLDVVTRPGAGARFLIHLPSLVPNAERRSAENG